MRRLIIILAGASLAMPVPALAEVASSDEGGFVVTGSADVAASPAELWAALLEPARYWNGDHSWSTDAANMAIEPRAGGCFCETIPGGGSAEKPVGLVWFDVARKFGENLAVREIFQGDRATIRQAAVARALELLEDAVAS